MRKHKERSKTMIEKPTNPNAAEDFANAVKEAMKDVVEEVKHNYNEFPKDESKVIPHLIWDMPTKYCGVVRFPTSALWESCVDTLIDNGYEVTVRKEDATETERELDGVDKFVVIEYEEVE